MRLSRLDLCRWRRRCLTRLLLRESRCVNVVIVIIVVARNISRLLGSVLLKMREVKTGIASRTDIEILDGINEGEQVVEGPYRTLARELQDGNAVKVQQPKPAPGGAPGPQGGRS